MNIPRITDFEILEKLGSGNYASVFKARHKKTNTYHAIKVVEKASLSRSATDNLVTEIQLLKNLTHKHIVGLNDFFWDDKNIYIGLEYCNAGCLSTYIRQRRVLPESTCKYFLRQLAQAVQYMRSNDVSHFDLKPQNLLLTRYPNVILKVADFGFAQHLKLGEINSSMKGSPLYMAPEIVLRHAYDARADLWSIGVILYECLFGKAPYSSKSIDELLLKIKRQEKIVIPSNSQISSECRDLLIRLLKHDPDSRITFQDFFEHPFLDLKHSPSDESLEKAIAIVTEAVQQDERQNYKEAYHLYCKALQYFVPLITAEIDSVKRQALRNRTLIYLNRAEEIKTNILADNMRRQQTVTDFLEPDHRHKQLHSLSSSSPLIRNALDIGRQGELYLYEKKFQSALESLTTALGMLVPLLNNEPKGERRNLLHQQIDTWMKEAESIKSLLSARDVESDQNMSSIYNCSLQFAQHLKLGEINSSMKGSPLYMAPEIVLRHAYDARADLWSIGVILYECLFGKAPYSSKSIDELLLKIKRQEKIVIPSNSQISSECRDLLIRLLKHDPDSRITFQDFFEHPFLDLKHSPSDESLEKAIAIVTEAVQQDERQNYKEAYHLYCKALQYFVPLITAEIDSVKRQALRNRTLIYLNRAEEIKTNILADNMRRQQTVTDFLEPDHRHKQLHSLSSSSPLIRNALDIGRQGELYLYEKKFQSALESLTTALGMLVPLLNNEPKGERRNLLHQQIDTWMKEAESIKSLLSARDVESDQNMSSIYNCSLQFAQHLKLGEINSSMKGSPLYMAPEIVLRHAYDARADLWSIGVILYECLFGKAPYSSKSIDELLLKIKRQEKIVIPSNSQISSECRDLLIRLLKHDPDSRITFQDFFEHPFLDLKHSPSDESLEKAIAIVTEAVQQDERQNYKEAYHLYCKALQYFVPLITAEIDSVKRQALRNRTLIYLNRAEEIKTNILADNMRRQQTVTDFLEPDHRHKQLHSLSSSSPLIRNALDIGRQGELYLYEKKFQSALESLTTALGMLVPLLNNEPKGERRNLLHQQIDTWMKEAESIKSLLSARDVESDQNMSSIYNCSLQ